MEKESEANANPTPVQGKSGDELNEQELDKVSGGAASTATNSKANDGAPEEEITFVYGKLGVTRY